MIDNYNEIKRITGYEPGVLYEYKHDSDKPYEIEMYKTNKSKNGCTYDDKTFNFHMLPDDKDLFERISSEISEKRKSIVLSLKEHIKGNANISVLRSGERGNISNLPGKTEKHYDSSGKLFSYIKIHYDGCNYYMMFVSFTKTKDRKINSYLKKIQFIKETCDPGYPDESSDFSEVGYGRVYSNPKISFYDSNDIIAKCFLEFIGYVRRRK